MRTVIGGVIVMLMFCTAPVWATGVTETAAGSPGQRLVTTQFLISGSYTPTSNLILISGCGAGGGGAGGHTADPGGGGGGGGGATCVEDVPLIVTPGTSTTGTGATGVVTGMY